MKNDPFVNFPVLTTAHLVLRRLSPEDRDDLFEIASFGSNPEVKAEPMILIDTLEKDYVNKNSINWGITLNNTLIGTCGFYRGFSNHQGEIGFVMREKYRRYGYMKEALECIMNFGYKELNLKCILAYTRFDNIKAQNLLYRLEFIKLSEQEIYWEYGKHTA